MSSLFRRFWFRWFVFTPLGLVVFAASALFVSFHLMRAAATPRRDKMVADLDATDPGWRTTDLTAARNAKLPPPEQNAAVLATQAHEKLPKRYTDWNNDPATSVWMGELKHPHLPNPADVTELRKHLTEANEAVELARQIRHVPGGGLAYDFREPDIIGTSLEPQQRLRRTMGLLAYDAMLRAFDHKGDEALESCHATLAVARGVGDDPTVISQFIRMAGDAIAVGSTERALGWCDTFDDATLAELGQAFEKEASEPRLVYAFRGERAIFYRVCENIDSGAMGSDQLTGAPPSPLARLQSAPVRARMPEDQALGLELYTKLIAVAARPAGRDRNDALWDIEESLYRRLRSVHVLGPFRPYPITSLLMTAVSKTVEADTRTVATLTAARVALACERHRLKTGAFPAALADLPKELLSEIPTDPYTGKPLLYKALDGGAVVYCTGPDRTDDGGTALDPSGKKGTDVGFRLFDAKHRRQPPLPKAEHTDPFATPGLGIDPDPPGGRPTAPPPLSPRK